MMPAPPESRRGRPEGPRYRARFIHGPEGWAVLKIRPEQVVALEQVSVASFKGELVRHLKDFAPRHAEVIGEAGLRRVVDLGIERAEAHGFNRRGPVTLYVELTMLLGCDFDRDPQLPWVLPALQDPHESDQMRRAERLHAAALAYLERVAGPDLAYARNALRRAKELNPDAFPSRGEGFEGKLLAQLSRWYPEKADYLGEDRLRLLVRTGLAEARRHGVRSGRGAGVFIGLMFVLGVGFAHDPQHPWIAGTLDNPAIADPEKRAERLYSKAMTYLDRVLLNLGV
jgi:hypothetical protein